jgi:hypothetical protein
MAPMELGDFSECALFIFFELETPGVFIILFQNFQVEKQNDNYLYFFSNSSKEIKVDFSVKMQKLFSMQFFLQWP